MQLRVDRDRDSYALYVGGIRSVMTDDTFITPTTSETGGRACGGERKMKVQRHGVALRYDYIAL